MSQQPDAIEYPISEARDNLAELAARAEAGEVVYLTRYGQRTAALVPPDSASVASEAQQAVSRVIAQHKDVFDRLADT